MTGPAPAVSPYVPFYAEAQPYITVDEYLAAPTGVDVSQLIPGGTAAANAAALATRIMSASAYADSLCYQVLGATTDMATGEFRIFRDGTIRVPLPFTPVIEVTNVALGWRAGQLQNLSDLSGVWFQRKVVRIPVQGLSASLGAYAPASCARSGSVFAEVTYVNGYPNTVLAADVAAAASSIDVKGTLGLFAGMPLTISDDKNGSTETVTVASSYVAGSTTVPLAAPLASSHKAGVSVSALPRPIKEAVIALTSHLIKTRGAESLVLSGVSGGPTHTEKDVPGSDEEYDLATDLLHPFRRSA